VIGRNITKSGMNGKAPSNRNSKRTLRKRKRNRHRKQSTMTLKGNNEKAEAIFKRRQKPSRVNGKGRDEETPFGPATLAHADDPDSSITRRTYPANADLASPVISPDATPEDAAGLQGRKPCPFCAQDICECGW